MNTTKLELCALTLGAQGFAALTSGAVSFLTDPNSDPSATNNDTSVCLSSFSDTELKGYFESPILWGKAKAFTIFSQAVHHPLSSQSVRPTAPLSPMFYRRSATSRHARRVYFRAKANKG